MINFSLDGLSASIKFTHFRNENTISVSPTGKKKAKKDTFTECLIEFTKNSELNKYIGCSYVDPSDQFDAEYGRRASLERALHLAVSEKNLTKKQERQFWVAYFSR